MQPRRFAPVLIWAVVALPVLTTVSNVSTILQTAPGSDVAKPVVDIGWAFLGLLYASVGAFLVTRRPANVVGYLLLGPGLAGPSTASSLMTMPAPPDHVTFVMYLQLWFDNISWVLMIFPVMLILSLFPTGRPPNPRWRWHPRLVVAMTVAMMVFSLIADRIGPLEAEWTVKNPVGFVPMYEGSPFLAWFNPIWTMLLLVITVGGVAAMIVRYRRGSWAERQQVKLLLYAFTLFGLVYAGAALGNEWAEGYFLDLLLIPSMGLIPVAIAVAILKHRLFDIDVIIRRTIVYVVVMGLLAAVFGLSVLAVQGIVRRLTGQESQLAVAASTLLAVALFNPLRVRVARTVGRRFFRGGYDLEEVVHAFSGRVRDETDLEFLTEDLLTAVTGTLHPKAVGITILGGPSGPALGTLDPGR